MTGDSVKGRLVAAGDSDSTPSALPDAALLGLSLAAIALGGLLLLAARSGMASAFDRLRPVRSSPSVELAQNDVAPSPELLPADRIEAPAVPSWSLLDVTQAVQTVTPQVEALIQEGFSEVPEFRDIDSSNNIQAKRMQNRWQAWGRIWQNRIAVVEKQMPPAEDCAVHAAMEPACQTFAAVFGELRNVSSAANIETAKGNLESADAILQALLNPPTEDPEESNDQDEVAADES